MNGHYHHIHLREEAEKMFQFREMGRCSIQKQAQKVKIDSYLCDSTKISYKQNQWSLNHIHSNILSVFRFSIHFNSDYAKSIIISLTIGFCREYIWINYFYYRCAHAHTHKQRKREKILWEMSTAARHRHWFQFKAAKINTIEFVANLHWSHGVDGHSWIVITAIKNAILLQ